MMRCLLFIWIILLPACAGKKQSAHKEHDDVYYTCSMDPQVIENKPGKCPICKMPLTAVRRSSVQDADELQLSNQQIQLGNITVDTVRSGTVGNEMVLTAVLNFDPSGTSAVSSRVMGRIDRLYFKNVGDYIRKGDRLYEIYSEELNNAKQEYLLALERKKTFSSHDVIDFDALLQSAKNKLRLWGMSDAQISQLESSGKIHPLTTYYSPESGYVTSLDISQGDYIMEGGTIVQLADLSTLWAEAQVYTTMYAQLNPNAAVTVRIPESGMESIRGRISFVHPEVVPDSRINLIRVSIPNRGNSLKPGMAAYVHLKNDLRSTLTLPIDAVIRDSRGATVWVKTGANSFKNRMIQVGAEMDGRIEVRSGLAPGDLVVITGAYLLNSEFVFKKGVDPMAGHEM